jgi:hypothetical protein
MMHWARVIGVAAGTVVVACLSILAVAPLAVANEVVQWNETTMKVIEANGQVAVVSTRTLAMVQGAVHDALNAINRKYDAYYFEGPADPAASPDAAVAAAAHTVLVGVVNSFGTPAQKVAALALAEQAYAASMARVTASPARNQGVAVGRAAGAAMLALRRDDGVTATRPIRRAWAPASGGRIRIPSPPTRPSPIRTPRAAISPRPFRLGKRDPVHAALGIAVLASGAAGIDQRHLRAGLQRGQERRRQGQHSPHR